MSHQIPNSSEIEAMAAAHQARRERRAAKKAARKAGSLATETVVKAGPEYTYLDLSERKPLPEHKFVNLINDNAEKLRELVENAHTSEVELTTPANSKDASEAWQSVISRLRTKPETYAHWRKPLADADPTLPAEIVTGDYVEDAAMLPTRLTAVLRADTMTAEGPQLSSMVVYRGVPPQIQEVLNR